MVAVAHVARNLQHALRLNDGRCRCLLLSVWASVSSNRTRMLYAMWNTTYCTHFPAVFMGLGLCLSCVYVCVSSANRNVCTSPILRWLPKTKMAARTPEKEKERERQRWRQHAKWREKRLVSLFLLRLVCCSFVCASVFVLISTHSIKSCWHGPVCSLITYNRPINTSTNTHAHVAWHKLCR